MTIVFRNVMSHVNSLPINYLNLSQITPATIRKQHCETQKATDILSNDMQFSSSNQKHCSTLNATIYWLCLHAPLTSYNTISLHVVAACRAHHTARTHE